MTITVAVFGGSAPTPGTWAYREAYNLGRELALAGYTVMTGGYSGVMEAASRGAAEAGGHVIGVTVELFERRGLRPNRWVAEEVKLPTLRERLYHLVESSDAVVAAKGGVGTLSEVALTWSLLQVGEIPAKPVVLLGESWARIMETFRAESYAIPRDIAWIRLASRPDEVPGIIREWLENPPNIPLRLGDVV